MRRADLAARKRRGKGEEGRRRRDLRDSGKGGTRRERAKERRETRKEKGKREVEAGEERTKGRRE